MFATIRTMVAHNTIVCVARTTGCRPIVSPLPKNRYLFQKWVDYNMIICP